MWFAGLLIGLLIGSLEGWGHAFFGAMAGAVAGAILGSALKARFVDGKAASGLADLEFKIGHIYKSLEDIHWRLLRLEKPGEQHTPEAPSAPAYQTPPQSTRTVSDHAGHDVVPEADVAASTRAIAQPPAATQPAADAGAGSIAVETPPQAQPVSAARPEPPVPTQGPWATQDTPDTSPAKEEASWWQRLFSGNIVAKVGVVILFFGIAFLLKYAYDHALLPVPLRLGAVAAAGLGMLWGGWRLRATRRLYGLILQGGGIGVLYLDVFFALRVYSLVEPNLSFVLFMVLGVVATLLAVKQDAKVLAVLGLSGAFLAPVLAGSREGDHVVLFSYYMLLNAFILAISWFRSWRDLNLTGFIFTFVVGIFWGANNYRPELFATVEPFVLIFFAMYLVIPILFAARQPPDLKGMVDGTLVFGTPLAAAVMQAGLVRGMPYGLAWSAGCAAGLYTVLALLVLRREGLRLLGETYVALAVVFATMTIFFALDAYPTFALWTLEGTAIVWVGLRQRRLLARFLGIALQFAGAALFLLNYSRYDLMSAWFNDFVLGCLLIAAAGIITAWLMHKHREVLMEGGEAAAAVLLVWGCGWWFVAGLHALHDGVPKSDFHAVALIFTAASFAVAETAGGWLAWNSLRLMTRAHLPALVVGILTIGSRHPLAQLGAVAWPLNFVVLFWCLHWQHRDGIASLQGVRYRLGWLVLAVLATWEACWLFDHRYFRASFLIGALGIAVAGLRYYLRERNNTQAGKLSVWVLSWGLIFWLLSGLSHIHFRVASELHIAYGLGLVVVSCLLFEIIGSWLQWHALRRTQLLLLPAMAVAIVSLIDRDLHPSAGYAWLAWIAAFSAFYVIAFRQQQNAISLAANTQHVVAVWFATGLTAWELAWQFAEWNPGASWPFAMWGLVPAAVMFALARYGRDTWPWGQDFGFFHSACLGPIAFYCAGWSLLSSWDPGRATWLPYLPLLNPIDLAQMMAVLGLYTWLRAPGAVATKRAMGDTVLAALGFVWVNSIVLRTMHHWADVPYTAHDLFNSIVVQAALSLLWTVTAMALMVAATRNLQRKLWMVGVVLLAVVVGKLFLLDLANSGTIERIVSFLGVGALIMLIGYVAPVPPGDAEKQQG